MPPAGRDDAGHAHVPPTPLQTPASRVARLLSSLLTIPSPVKALFDKFPVQTYAPNPLPQRAASASVLPSLYVFCSEQDAAAGRPSYNPACLKWQAFLKVAGIQHRLVSSNNHASPTGVLPFLLTPSCNLQDTPPPIPSAKLVKFALENGSDVKDPPNARYEVYQSLLDHRIRNAWLYSLYLDPLNYKAVATPLYVHPTSRSLLVRDVISRQLQSAAESELRKNSPVIDINDLYSEADKAFEALSIFLGHDEWFFGCDSPTLLDASVFAYTHLLLDERMRWKGQRLVRMVRKRVNLVEHRDRLLVRYFSE